MKRLKSGMLIALCVLLSACDEPAMLASDSDEDTSAVSSAKRPKDPTPPGTIFFVGWIGDDGDVRQMDASGESLETFPGLTGGPIPSREAHGGYRWFLHVETVAGTYTDGVAREEVFATGAQAGNPSTTTVQLTNDPTVHPRDVSDNLWWSPGDAKIGFRGRRLDATGHVTEGGLFVLEVSFDSNAPAPVGSPVLAVPTAIRQVDGCMIGSGQVCERSVLHGFDWSPDMDRIVYGDLDAQGSAVIRIAGAGIDLAAGYHPRWSPPTLPDYPDGRILFNALPYNNHLWTAVPQPDGSGSQLQEVVSVSDKGPFERDVRSAVWSPTGEHIAYGSLEWNSNVVGIEVRVFRVQADGGKKTCLTCRDFEVAAPLGWW